MASEADRLHALNVVWGVSQVMPVWSWQLREIARLMTQYGPELESAVRVLKEGDGGQTDEDSWQPPIPDWIPTSNFSTGLTPQGVVLHSTRGGNSTGGEYKGTINWFLNPASEASAHFIIARDGRITQMVNLTDRAWHAGAALNRTHYGIEFEQPFKGDPITDRQYTAGGYVLQILEDHVGSPLPLVEHYKTQQGAAQGKSDIGPPFSVARLQAALDARR